MSKKTYRIYKAGGANEGRVMNPTAQFLARAQEGMQQPSQDEMQMMQQQQQQLMQLIQEYSQIMQSSPEEVMQELQQSSPENQEMLIAQMTQVVQEEMAQQEQPAEQQQPIAKNGYVKARFKELKEANEGIELEESSSTSTINDAPNGREVFVSDFTNAVKTSASDAAIRKQAEEEFDSGNIPMARYGRGRARRQEKQDNRRAVRQIDRESDMYSRPDRRLLRRGLREGDFTREEMLRGDNVLGKAGYPYMAPPGSTPMQSEEELLYTPEQVFDMLPYNTATPQEQVVKTTEAVEEAPGENVIQPNGDPYEYKNEDGVLYTRKKGSDKWIKVDPESKAGKEIRKKVYDEELEGESKMTQEEQLAQTTPEIDEIRKKYDIKDGRLPNESASEMPIANEFISPSQGDFSPRKTIAAATAAQVSPSTFSFFNEVNPALAARLSPGIGNMLNSGARGALPSGSNLPAKSSNAPAVRGNKGLQSELQKGAGALSQILGAIGKTSKMLPYSAFANLTEGDQYQTRGDDATEMMKIINPSVSRTYSKGSTRSLAEGGEMDLPEARFGRQQRMLNRFLRRQNKRNPMGFGMNQFGIPSSGLNMITPYGVAGSEGMQEKTQGSQEMFPGDFHMSTKYGLFGRPRRVDIDYTGNMPFNFMSPLMTGFFGQGFPTNTAYGGRYQSGIRYEDPITTVAKVVNKDQTTTDAEKQTEERNENDGKSKGSSKKSEPTKTASSEPNEFIRRDGIRGDSPLEAVGLPSVMDVINKNASKVNSKGATATIDADESRPINAAALAYAKPAVSPFLLTPGPGASIGILSRLLGQGSSAPKALGAGQRMLNPGQKLLEAPGGTQFTLFQPGGFVDPNDVGYGNPDLYKFISGGIDQADIDYMNSKDVTDAYMMNEGGVNPITGVGTTVGDITNVTNRYTYNSDGTRGGGIANDSAEAYLSNLNNPTIGPSGSVMVDGNVVAKGFQDYYKRPSQPPAQDGLEVYQDKGEVQGLEDYNKWRNQSAESQALSEYNRYMNRTSEPGMQNMVKYNANTNDPVYNRILQNYQSNNQGSPNPRGFVSESMDPRYGGRPNPNWQPTPGFSPDPRMQYRPQQGFPMPAVGYGRQQYPMQRANPMGMLAGSAFGNTYGFRGAGQPPILSRAGSYWTQTGFPGQPVNMNNLTSAKFKGRQGLFGPRGKAEFTFNGASGDGKQSTDPLITLDKNKGSMIEGPGKQAEQSGYMTNRQFARDQMQNDPSMSGRDKRELRRQLNKGQTTQLEYLDRQADVESMMNDPRSLDKVSAGQLNTTSPGMPQIQQNGNPYMQSPGMESMPSRPADQIQTGGYDAPTGPAAGSAQAISGTPEITPTYSFGQPQRSGSASGYGTPSVSSGSASSDPYADGVYDYGERNDPNSELVKKYKDFGATYTNKDGVGSALYKEGGEYDLTESEIALIMQAGGMVEYI